MAEASTGRLVSVNVGLPRDVEWEGRTVHTGIWKEPVDGRRMVRRLNVDGDGQGDLAGHGGVNRAVFVYQIESYRYWQQFLGRDDFTYGQFGENFTVEGLADDDVCIGDRYRIGSALFEVSQPRVTCYRLGLRMNEPRMPALVVAHHRPGFYLRVLEEGEVGAGDAIERVERGPEAMTVADVDALLYLPGHAPPRPDTRVADPGAERGMAGLLPRLAGAAPDGGTAAPAWTGMRPMRVAAIDRESTTVISVTWCRRTARPRCRRSPGSSSPLRLHPDPAAAPLLRTYSLSGMPSADSYRISVKREPHGAASEYLHDRLRVGDVIEVGAPRGSFVLRAGDRPVVLISAGVGATPVLAMLHVLAARARRDAGVVGAQRAQRRRARVRGGGARDCSRELPDAHHLVCYSQPDARRSRVRPPRAAHGRSARAGGRSDRRRLLPVRTGAVHARHHRGPHRSVAPRPSGSAPRCSVRPRRSRRASSPSRREPPHPPAGDAGIGPS